MWEDNELTFSSSLLRSLPLTRLWAPPVVKTDTWELAGMGWKAHFRQTKGRTKLGSWNTRCKLVFYAKNRNLVVQFPHDVVLKSHAEVLELAAAKGVVGNLRHDDTHYMEGQVNRAIVLELNSMRDNVKLLHATGATLRRKLMETEESLKTLTQYSKELERENMRLIETKEPPPPQTLDAFLESHDEEEVVRWYNERRRESIQPWIEARRESNRAAAVDTRDAA